MTQVSSRPNRQPILYGRSQECQHLRACLDEVLAGRGRLVLVSGEAGIGKTALVNDFIQHARQNNVLTLTGGCYDLTTTPPYGPWAEIMSVYQPNDKLPEFPDALREDKLESLGSQDKHFQAVRDFFVSIAATQPLVLVMEDVYWSDSASLELLRFLARRTSDHRILIISSYRDDEITRRDLLFQLLPTLVRESAAIRLELTPLDRSALTALIGADYDLAADDQGQLVEYISNLSEGNPLFARELLRMLEHDAVLQEHEKGNWRLSDLDERHVPPLVLQVIENRLATLDESTRGALGIAAVIGQEVPLSLWEAITELPSDMLDEVVARAIETRVLELVAEGLTNAAVAEQLFISPRTVSQHLRSIYNKLGVNSRAAAVARWAELNS